MAVFTDQWIRGCC